MKIGTVDELRYERDKNNGKIKSKVTYTQDWAAYNKAQTREGRLFQELLKDLVEEIEEDDQDNGRPKLPLKEQAFCAILKVYFQLSGRRVISLFEDAEEKNRISRTPHFNAVGRFLNREDATSLLERLIAITARPFISVETVFAVDSSGFRTTSFNEYCRNKHNVKRRHNWLKAHIGVGVKTNVVAGAEVTGGYANDCPQFKRIMTQVSENGFLIDEVSADKAYSSIMALQAVKNVGGTPYIPFKSNVTPGAHKKRIWKKMYHYFKANQEEFMEHYHKRSNVETTFHMIKMKFGDKLKSKNFIAQKNELLCKIIAHNIVVLIHEMHELGIEPNFNTTVM